MDLFGLQSNAMGPALEFRIQIGGPVRRPETGHWVCRASIRGLEHSEWHYAANTAVCAERGLLADLHDVLESLKVEMNPKASAILEDAASVPFEENNDPKNHRTRIEISGLLQRGDGSSETVIARIHPVIRDDRGGVECQLDIDGLSDQPFMLSGNDFAQAREQAFILLEQIFEQNGVMK